MLVASSTVCEMSCPRMCGYWVHIRQRCDPTRTVPRQKALEMVDVATQLGKENHELHKQEAIIAQLEQVLRLVRRLCSVVFCTDPRLLACMTAVIVNEQVPLPQ